MSRADAAAAELRRLRVNRIDPNPRNPREKFDEEKIRELAESIDAKGLLQPVLVRPKGEQYELVHGERRLRAVESLGRDRIKAEVRDLDDGEALEVAITENLQREDVNPLAEARGYRELINEFDLTQSEAADRLGVSQSKVANQLRLLNLPDTLQDYILHKIITPWQARVIASVWEDWNLLDLTLDADLSVSELREIKSQLKEGDGRVRYTRRWDVSRLESLLGERDLTEVFNEEERRESFKSRELTHGLVWAKENLGEPYTSLENRAVEESGDVGAVTVSAALGYIVFGEHRVRLALQEGYGGDMAVKITMPTRVLRRVDLTRGEAK
jgi:ParB family chromosome partitioning protein